MKKIFLLAAVITLSTPLSANAGLPDVRPPVPLEQTLAYTAAKCLGHPEAYSQMAADRFSNGADAVSGMTLVLTNKAKVVIISPSGTCTKISIKAQAVHPLGIAYIPDPSDRSTALVEIQANPDGSRVFTDGL